MAEESDMDAKKPVQTKRVDTHGPEWDAVTNAYRRAMRLTAELNQLSIDDAPKVRALFSELIGQEVDEKFNLVPPFYTEGGANIRVGRKVFINQCCTIYDMGGVEIGDLVMIGPNVNIITASHPLEPSKRRAYVEAKPIVIEKNVWIATAVTILGGVTIGENSVIGAGAVVTKDVPANCFVAGVPAKVIRSLEDSLTAE
jgi:acetyltransferase-like isoleucine patch superfamily enzyme